MCSPQTQTQIPARNTLFQALQRHIFLLRLVNILALALPLPLPLPHFITWPGLAWPGLALAPLFAITQIPEAAPLSASPDTHRRGKTEDCRVQRLKTGPDGDCGTERPRNRETEKPRVSRNLLPLASCLPVFCAAIFWFIVFFCFFAALFILFFSLQLFFSVFFFNFLLDSCVAILVF